MTLPYQPLRDVISDAGHNPDLFCYNLHSDGCWRADALWGAIVDPRGPTVYLNDDGTFEVMVPDEMGPVTLCSDANFATTSACLRGLSW